MSVEELTDLETKAIERFNAADSDEEYEASHNHLAAVQYALYRAMATTPTANAKA